MITNTNLINVFPIINLAQLAGEYRLFEIEGLDLESKYYQRNKQFIIKKLSRDLKHPIEIIKKDGKSFLVTKNDPVILEALPKEYSALQNNTLYFKSTDKVFSLDFNSKVPSDRIICKRFLQFSIQGTIFKNKRVWQPNVGKPFYSKKAIPKNGVDIYPGFTVRVVDLKDGEWGVSIDATRKYLKPKALPTYLTKEIFDRYYKNKRVVYKLGHQWYEIKLTQWHSLTVSKHKYPTPDGNDTVTLLDDIRNKCSKPHPKLLANLPKDGSVVFYSLSNGEMRSVPSGLCFLVLGTEDEMDGHLHQNSILSPDIRLNEIHEIRDEIITNLMFGDKQVELSKKLLTVPKNKFDYPDIIVGNEETIEYANSNFNPLNFAKLKTEKILNSELSGFLKPVQPILGPQYIFLPRSIYDTVKNDFVQRIINDVNSMYPWYDYNPKVEYYEDVETKRNNYVGFGQKIVSDIKAKHSSDIHSHALVMIPSLVKGKRQHDRLSALVIRELKKLNISASIIHSSTANECYEERSNRNGELFYNVIRNKTGKLKGYTRNVSLVKILLHNKKYPFALKSPLNADLTIGIDVKNNLAGFVYIDKYARNIHPEFVDTTHKEKLPSKIIAKQLYASIKIEAKNNNLEHIVLQRDGRIYDSEIQGISLAMKKLKSENILAQETMISIVEIPKNSFLSFRLFSFDRNARKQNASLLNPEIGSYYILNDNIAYVCTTGKEFLKKGTSKPLMVKFISGKMPFKDILQDVFSLSTLTFTKIDDCSRLPFTIKILDILLRGLASEYDEEALEYLDFESLEELDLLKTELNLN